MAKKSKSSGGDKLVNLQAQQLAAQVANWAAQLEFSKERFRLLELPEFQTQSAQWTEEHQLKVDELAWTKAEDTWKRAYQEAALTGTYQGQPTTEWLMAQAKLTGVLNGQQTLEGKLTDAQIKEMNEKLRLQNEEFLASTTGYYQGKKTFEREQWEQSQGLEGLKLLSSLQGPGNAFKQLRVLGNMGDLTALSNAWMGKYAVGGTTGSGSNPGQAQVSDLMSGWGGGGARFDWGYTPFGQPTVDPTQTQVAAVPGGPYPNPAGSTTPGGVTTPPTANVGYTVSPAGTQANPGSYNYEATPSGQTQVYPPGVAAPAGGNQVSTQVPVSHADAQAMYGANLGGAYQPGVAAYNAGVAGSGALMPNQINAENYENTNIYAKKLGWAAFENSGWDIEAAQDAYRRSLPKYAGPQAGAYGF